MITDDEVMQLFERADPARVSDVDSRVDAAGYLDALRTRSTDMTLVENPPRRSDPKARSHRWLLMGAAAAVVVVVLGALVVANREDSTGVVTDQTPVATSAPPAPAPAAAPTEAESVAANFLAAYDGVRRGRGRCPPCCTWRRCPGLGTPQIGDSASASWK